MILLLFRTSMILKISRKKMWINRIIYDLHSDKIIFLYKILISINHIFTKLIVWKIWKKAKWEDLITWYMFSCLVLSKKHARSGRTTYKSIFIYLQNLHLLRLSIMLTCLVRYYFKTLKINLIFFPCIVLRANAVTIILMFKQA